MEGAMSEDALIVLQARRIPQAMMSIAALPSDTAWFSAFDEPALVAPLNQFIARTNYRRYMLVADDVVADAAGFSRLTTEAATGGYGCLTGWCRLCEGDERVNLSSLPLTRGNGSFAQWSDYTFMDRAAVLAGAAVQRSYLAGWVFTSAARETWLRHPFAVNKVTGRQSDYEWSMALQNDGIQIHAIRDCEVRHLKLRPDAALTEGWIIGKEAPSITLKFA